MNKWTQEEADELLFLYNRRVPVNVLAKRFNRSPYAISEKAGQLGIRRRRPRAKKFWLEFEVRKITKMIQEGATHKELLVAFPERTPQALRHMSSKIKNNAYSSRYRYWSNKDKEKALGLASKGKSYNEILRHFPDRTLGSLRKLFFRNNVRVGKPCRPFSPEEERKIRLYFVEGRDIFWIAKVLNRSICTIRKRYKKWR